MTMTQPRVYHEEEAQTMKIGPNEKYSNRNKELMVSAAYLSWEKKH